MAFLGMLFIFFLGNKLCDEIEEEDRAKDAQLLNESEKAAAALQPKSLREMYCANQNTWTLNAGVAFLCMAAFKAYYNKISGKLDQAQTKMDRLNALARTKK